MLTSNVEKGVVVIIVDTKELKGENTAHLRLPGGVDNMVGQNRNYSEEAAWLDSHVESKPTLRAANRSLGIGIQRVSSVSRTGTTSSNRSHGSRDIA